MEIAFTIFSTSFCRKLYKSYENKHNNSLSMAIGGKFDYCGADKLSVLLSREVISI